MLRAASPTGKVPVLIDGDLLIWESLAICEALAEWFPDAKLWPDDPGARAFARSVAYEMHGGFPDLRREMPMNLRARIEAQAVFSALARRCSAIALDPDRPPTRKPNMALRGLASLHLRLSPAT